VLHDPVLHSHPQGRSFLLKGEHTTARPTIRRTLKDLC
jgi:hypothetical protein